MPTPPPPRDPDDVKSEADAWIKAFAAATPDPTAIQYPLDETEREALYNLALVAESRGDEALAGRVLDLADDPASARAILYKSGLLEPPS